MAIVDPVNLPPSGSCPDTEDDDTGHSLHAGTCLRVKTGGGTSPGYLGG